MTTLQAVIDLGRFTLNDDKDGSGSDANCRYNDADLLRFAITALLQAWRNRSDLFVGGFANPPLLTWAASQTFPLPDEYVQPIADYVTARAESRDDEFTVDGRAQAFLALFGGVVS